MCVHRLFGRFVVPVLGLQIFAVLDGVVGLKQEVPYTVLIFKVKRPQADNVVAVDNLPNFAIERFESLVRAKVRLVVVDSKVLQILLEVLLLLDQIALGEYGD